MSTTDLSEELSRNFHALWDNFPFPVMLTRKDRTVLDRNRAAEARGFAPGTRCSDLGEKGDHAGCLANAALREQVGKRVVGYVAPLGKVLDTYWIPVVGHDDLYLHFSTDITEYAADRLLPAGCVKGVLPGELGCADTCGSGSELCGSCTGG